MRTDRTALRVVLVCCICIAGPDDTSAEAAHTVTPLLNADATYRHVVFSKLPPTSYELEAGVLVARVDRSSSFLLFPFGKALPIDTVEWEWRGIGGPRLSNAEHEESKNGDDAQLRIGLVLQGDEPFSIPLFMPLPAWIKQVRTYLLPQTTNTMLFLISGGKHADGHTWPSPHADEITHRAVIGEAGEDGWYRSSVTLTETESVIGLWLMADGDDTNAQFETRLRNLMLRGPADREQEQEADE